METVTDFIFLGSKITEGGDCSHEIKRCLLLGRKTVTNLHSILKSRAITWPTKVRIVKAVVFLVVTYGCERWTIKKAEWWFLNCGVGEHSFESPLESRRSILKEIKLEQSLKDWCWSWSSNTLATWCEELTHWKRPWCWEGLRAGREGDNRKWDGWMASLIWRTWVWISSGVGDRQGSLMCCSPWGRKELDMSEWLNWTETSISSTASGTEYGFNKLQLYRVVAIIIIIRVKTDCE